MRRAAAPSRRAAAAVEDRQLDAPGRGDPRQLLLGAVDLPLRRQVAAVLARVGVADHHLERARAGCGRGSPPRAGRPRAGRRSSRAAARPASAAPASRASASASRTSSAVRVIETISRSTAATPCRCLRARGGGEACRGAARPGARIAEAWTRRSSFARWRPNVRARARRSARPPSATRSPRWARSSASRSSRSAEQLARRPRRRRRRAAPRSRRARRGTARRRRRRSGTAPITVVDIPHAAPSARSSAR